MSSHDEYNGFEKEIVLESYSQTIVSFRSMIKLMVQILTVLVLGDITIIGFAFENKSASLLLVGAIFPITILIVIFIFKRLLLPLGKLCESVESKYNINRSHGLASVFLSYLLNSKGKINFSNSVIYRIIVLLIAALHFAIALYLFVCKGWHFF